MQSDTSFKLGYNWDFKSIHMKIIGPIGPWTILHITMLYFI